MRYINEIFEKIRREDELTGATNPVLYARKVYEDLMMSSSYIENLLRMKKETWEKVDLDGNIVGFTNVQNRIIQYVNYLYEPTEPTYRFEVRRNLNVLYLLKSLVPSHEVRKAKKFDEFKQNYPFLTKDDINGWLEKITRILIELEIENENKKLKIETSDGRKYIELQVHNREQLSKEFKDIYDEITKIRDEQRGFNKGINEKVKEFNDDLLLVKAALKDLMNSINDGNETDSKVAGNKVLNFLSKYGSKIFATAATTAIALETTKLIEML